MRAGWRLREMGTAHCDTPFWEGWNTCECGRGRCQFVRIQATDLFHLICLQSFNLLTELLQPNISNNLSIVLSYVLSSGNNIQPATLLLTCWQKVSMILSGFAEQKWWTFWWTPWVVLLSAWDCLSFWPSALPPFISHAPALQWSSRIYALCF